MEPLLTTEEVAGYLRVEVVTVRRLVTRGDLQAYRIGGEFRFMEPDIESFVRSQRVSADDSRTAFEKFTERVRNVLDFANQEAVELDHNYIGTEHLLLGIIREGEGVAAQALLRSGLSFKEIRQYTMEVVETAQTRASGSPKAQLKTFMQGVFSSGRDPDSFGERALTARAKKVIELSLDEARRMDHHYIGTEHLLLGILREGNGLAAGVLIDKCGLQLDLVRKLVLQILQETSTISLPEIPEQAATLLNENEPGVECRRCGARSPEYFRYCFHCGLKFS